MTYGNKVMASIGEKLRAMRKQKGWTQEKLALESGFTQGYITHIETGKTRPLLDKLEVIADVLDVPIGYFFDAISCKEAGTYADLTGLSLEDIEMLKEFINTYREAPDEQKEDFRDIIRICKKLKKEDKR